MIGLQITEKGKIEQINKMEICDNVDSSKVKIIKTLLTPEDVYTYLGDDDAVYPVIPGRIAVGQISDASETAYLTKGTKVFINPVNNCGACIECLAGDSDKCADFRVAGKNENGYLRDFAVVKNSHMYALPPTVKDGDAMFIDYIALALAVIDKLAIVKGEHIAVIGGGVFGTVLSSLIIYYQAVPILIDNRQNNLDRAKLAGIYYNLFSDNKLEKSVSELTGAHMAQKVVYVSDCNINTDIALKLAGHNAKIGFVGFSAPNLKVNFHLAMQKQLEFMCITNGFGFTETAINMLANHAVDLSLYAFNSVKYDACAAEIVKAADEYSKNNIPISPILVDMM